MPNHRPLYKKLSQLRQSQKAHADDGKGRIDLLQVLLDAHTVLHQNHGRQLCFCIGFASCWREEGFKVLRRRGGCFALAYAVRYMQSHPLERS
jgi:hypothetical protein